MRWGYIYYPRVCTKDKEACKFTFYIHGCGGEAHENTKSWGEWASNNKLVVLFTQSAYCYDTIPNTQMSNGRNPGTYSNEGFTEIFFKKILDRVGAKRDFNKYDYTTVESEKKGAYDWEKYTKKKAKYAIEAGELSKDFVLDNEY